VTDRAMFRRLALQIERDLLTQKHLRTLLTVVDTALIDRRREFRNLKTRIARRSPE
jgi:hypothetical protein